jgi:membrane AbrB-like protein
VRRAAIWPVLAAAVLGGGQLLDLAGLPSSYLFAALIIGLALALLRPGALDVAPVAFRASQAIAGVSLGAYVQTEALRVVAGSLAPVLLVSAATLLASLAAGWALARTTPLDPPTAALGMIAGGASGIVGMSGELGADDRLVAFMQYLRVLVVVVLTPIGLAVLFGGGHHRAAAATVPSAGTLGEAWQWILAVVLAAAGAFGAARLRVTAGALLGPMVLTAGLVLSGAIGGFAVPGLLGQTAFALIGLQIGLRFTPATVRLLGRLTVPVLLSIAALLVACFGLAALLAATTSATMLDAYLATTPGGLYAVLAVAYGAGANTTFIVAVQSLRVIAMVLLAPLAVRWMLRRPRAAGASAAGSAGSPRSPRPAEASRAPSGSAAGRRTRRGRSR